MRRININDILIKKYSIKNNKVISEKKGKYFSEEIAKMIFVNLNHNDLENVKKLEKQDKRKHEKAVKKFCETKTKELKEEIIPSFIEKSYEIFKLDLSTENIYLLNKKELPVQNSPMEKQELFFKYENAKKALELLKKIYENIANNHEETIEIMSDEINEFKEELEFVRKKDEEDYLESVKLYTKIKNTDFMIQYKKILEENEKLENKIESIERLLIKSKERNKNLENKLKIALEEIEKNRNTGFLKKIFKKKQ